MTTTIKVKWGKEEYDVEVEKGSSVEVFKTQMWTITTVPVDKQKFLGFPGGMLKDTDNLDEKIAKLKPGAKVTMMGTAEGKELKQPGEKVIFEEDLTADEKAKILKERKVEILPGGLKNLGNTCYMNSCLQCLAKIKELNDSLKDYVVPGAERDIDAVLTNQLKNTFQQLAAGSAQQDAVTPIQFVMALRQKFPRFAEMQNGGYMQQDADECLRGILQSLSQTLTSDAGNRIDDLFSFNLQSSMKCLENDAEEVSKSEDSQRVLICHLGTQTEPISHIYQGVALSLKEHIEKNSPTLGRNAQYEKAAAVASLPNYLIVQFARFGYKKANEWAGTSDSKVKLVRNIKFSPTLDLYDIATDDLKKQLSKGRLRVKEHEDKVMELEKKKLMEEAKGGSSSSAADAEGDVEMKDAAAAVGVEMIDTGYYDLVGMISHKGRTADGGHYVGWTLARKASKKDDVKDDQWICYDDEDTQQYDWKDITGVTMDLMGGRADTQMAYINIYKKCSVPVDAGQKLGEGEGYAAASGSGDVDMKPAQ